MLSITSLLLNGINDVEKPLKVKLALSVLYSRTKIAAAEFLAIWKLYNEYLFSKYIICLEFEFQSNNSQKGISTRAHSIFMILIQVLNINIS